MSQVSLEILVAPSTEMEVATKRWLIWLRAKGKSTATQDKYSYHLERLRVWLLERGVDRPDGMSRLLLDEYVAELHERWSPATVKQAVGGMRSFVRWAEDMGRIRKKQLKALLKALTLPKVPVRTQRTLRMSEVETLLAVCDLKTAKGQRDAALVSLLIDSGLRASEVRRLQVDDLEFEVELMPGVVVNRLSTIVKGNKQLPGYFGRRTARYMSAWLETRDQVAARGANEVFVSLGGPTPSTALSADGLRVILRKLGRKVGLKGVSPHAFRRGFACALEMAGASTRTIQQLGRWDELDMVLLYTRDYNAGMAYSRLAPLDYGERSGG